MPPLLSRSRTIRGGASPAESPVKEREPFAVGPFRHQKSFPTSSTPGRRSRANGENVPPDNVHTAAYVKANTQIQDGGSPAQAKSATKGRSGNAAPLPGSPALLPRPPSSKPSPGASNRVRADHSIPDAAGSIKRKLSWDMNNGALTENVISCHSAEIDANDSGVKVIVRMRPLNSKEEQEEATQVVQKVSANAVALGDQQFTYDAIAGELASQQEVFEMVGLPMVENCLAGFNSSIFAYGQTGSGKTHTMWGASNEQGADLPPSKERGIMPRVFEKLFARMQQEEKLNAGKDLRYQCRCSFLEIYNEQIADLLDPTQKNLQIREDTKTGVYVDNLSEEYVLTVEDVTRLLLKGLSNRRTGATSMNNESSRSHSVFTCVIESQFKNLSDGVNCVRSSRMNLVDLAGSERQKQTGAAGDRLKEAGNINKSLSQLGNVINILAEVAQTGKQRHIPYRDSRLTFLLQESLGGNAKLAMICAISPASSCKSETLSTLRFAQRAKAVQNKAVVNEETASDVNLLREQIRQLKDELMRMKTNGTQEPGSGGYSNGWNARRSYNLLRLSLSHPMTMPSADLDPDNDLEMEIDDDACESEPASKPAADAKGGARPGTLRLEAIEEKDWLSDTPMEMDGSETGEVTSNDPEELTTDAESPFADLYSETKDHNTDHHFGTDVNFDDDSPNFKTPESIKLSELSLPKLHSPPLSVSPRLKGSMKKGLTGSPLAPRVESAAHNNSSICDEIYHSTQERFADSTTSQSLRLNNATAVRSSLRASMSAARPTERLAACLHRGLQILDNQQRTSMAAVRSSTAGLRFSFQNTELRIPKMIDRADKAVQTSPPVFVTTSTSPLAVPNKSLLPLEEISSCELDLALNENITPTEVGTSTSPLNELVHMADETPSSNLKLMLTESVSSDEGEPETSSTKNLCLEVHIPASILGSPIHQNVLCNVPEAGPLSLGDPVVESGNTNLQLACTLLGDPEETSLPMTPSAAPKGSENDLQLTCISRSREDDEEENKCMASSAETKQLQVTGTQTPEFIGEKLSFPTIPSNHPSSSQDASQWQLAILDASKSLSCGGGNSSALQVTEAVENLLTGAIRRERVAEETTCRQAAEIEQLNRLVRQYKHERECNAILHQTREDKIARLESLMENVIPTDEYLNEEWSALLLEHQLLQENFDNHPEVTNSTVEQQRLLEELNKYRMFFDLGERDVLLEEISQLRNQLQNVLDHSGNNVPGKNRCLSSTRRSIQALVNHSKDTECSSPLPTNCSMHLSTLSSLGEDRVSKDKRKADIDLSLVVTDARSIEQLRWDEERQEWEERERDWMSALEEMREEVESVKRLAEKRKQEYECEKRCSEECQEALQMAMVGHARLLEQYAELQEKHIVLITKQRKIREATGDVKKMAKRAGVSNFESRWLDAQATQMAAMRVDFEEERKAATEEIRGLQAQLRDTAEAVQAAGELLVRLKEAEESVMVAQDSAAIAEQDANALRRDLEKSRRRHATEIATLQQRLLESRLQKTAVCPMCVMAERVKFQFSEVDAETAQATIEAEARAMALREEKEWMAKQRQLAAEEERRMQNVYDMDEFASVLTGELEDQGYESEGGLHLEEFDDLDHLFIPSEDACVNITSRTPEKKT